MNGLKTLIAIFVATLCIGCGHKSNSDYTNDILLPMTPMKDQGKTELCWAYAMLATIETEHIIRGDSINLSGVYVGRMLERESKRAMCQTLLNIIARDGIVGYDVLPDDATEDLGTPQWVFMLGARYTPQEFAHSVCAPEEYVALTCQPDSQYHQMIVVETPDNWEKNRFYNMPMDSLKIHVDEALKARHPICWESAGHAMEIVGTAHDKQKRKYYIMKNSWGTDQPNEGLVYMPYEEMWKKMIALYMTQDAYKGLKYKY